VRRAVSDSVWLALVGGAVLGLAIAIAPGHAPIAVDVYVLVLGALGLLAVARLTRAAHAAAGPSAFDEALAREPAEVRRPNELVRLEREVTLSVARAFDLHHKLRSTLGEIADHILRSRRGIVADESPELARAELGPAAWDLLRPDRPAPAERLGPGIPLHELSEVVDTLERSAGTRGY
jgi:hypothetical protein